MSQYVICKLENREVHSVTQSESEAGARGADAVTLSLRSQGAAGKSLSSLGIA